MKTPIAVALVILASTTACVSRQHDDYMRARNALDECLATHSGDEPACEAERQGLRKSAENFEDAARGSWGCYDEDDDCPRRR
jgi:hypothetical protein